MIRLWLHTAGAVALAFALAVGVIVAEPSDAAAIHAFFAAPEHCAAPCSFGIRPGVTTHDEALALLREQPWVADLNDDGASIRWMWNGSQPAFISSLGDSFYAGRIDFAHGVVAEISLPTAVRYGDFLTLFGSPGGAYSVNNYGPRSISITQTVGYFDAGFELEFTFRCPLRARDEIWNKMVIVTYPNQSPAEYDRINFAWWRC